MWPTKGDKRTIWFQLHNNSSSDSIQLQLSRSSINHGRRRTDLGRRAVRRTFEHPARKGARPSTPAASKLIPLRGRGRRRALPVIWRGIRPSATSATQARDGFSRCAFRRSFGARLHQLDGDGTQHRIDLHFTTVHVISVSAILGFLNVPSCRVLGVVTPLTQQVTTVPSANDWDGSTIPLARSDAGSTRPWTFPKNVTTGRHSGRIRTSDKTRK